MKPLSRKQLLRLTGAAAGGLALGAAGCSQQTDSATTKQTQQTGEPTPPAVEPFHGDHQAGIVTPQQKYLQFASFDVHAAGRPALVALLKRWTAAAEQLTAGKGSDGMAAFDPAKLTITIGFGSTLFDHRFGLTARRPAALVEIPHFKGDRMDPGASNGDIGVQCCSTSHEVAMRAVHAMVAAAAPQAAVRWMQDGHILNPLPGEQRETPRNLFGFKDGTNNLKPSDTAKMKSNVWVNPGDGVDWMTNGSYLVTRKIEMLVDDFLPEPLPEQQHAIGREKGTGAPIGQPSEFSPVIPRMEPIDAHIIIANPRKGNSQAERILRRGYTYTDGFDTTINSPTGGLFFMCYQRDPRHQFISIQSRLAVGDRMAHYVIHRTSALFAVPPGIKSGGFVGQGLLA